MDCVAARRLMRPGDDGASLVSSVAPRRRFHDGCSPWVETHGYPHPVAPRL